MISVIVPVYKVEQYLHRCVDSIINQTFSDLEIILVNDGSPDNCGQICDEYAVKDARVVVIHKENGGISDARNAGIEVAKGKYVTFIDSDDYIALNMLEHLMNRIEQHNADIAECAYLKVYDDLLEDFTHVPENEILLTGIEAMGYFFTSRGVNCVYYSVWGKLYKTCLFNDNGIRFPVGRLHEDVFTVYKVLYFAKEVVCSNLPLYYYFQRSDSFTGRGFNVKRLDAIEAALQAIDFVKTHNLPLTEQVSCYFIDTNRFTIDAILKETGWRQWHDVLKQLQLNIKNSSGALKNRYIPRIERMYYLFLFLGYWCYIPLMKLRWAIKKSSKFDCGMSGKK